MVRTQCKLPVSLQLWVTHCFWSATLRAIIKINLLSNYSCISLRCRQFVYVFRLELVANSRAIFTLVDPSRFLQLLLSFEDFQLQFSLYYFHFLHIPDLNSSITSLISVMINLAELDQNFTCKICDNFVWQLKCCNLVQIIYHIQLDIDYNYEPLLVMREPFISPSSTLSLFLPSLSLCCFLSLAGGNRLRLAKPSLAQHFLAR